MDCSSRLFSYQACGDITNRIASAIKSALMRCINSRLASIDFSSIARTNPSARLWHSVGGRKRRLPQHDCYKTCFSCFLLTRWHAGLLLRWTSRIHRALDFGVKPLGGRSTFLSFLLSFYARRWPNGLIRKSIVKAGKLMASESTRLYIFNLVPRGGLGRVPVCRKNLP